MVQSYYCVFAAVVFATKGVAGNEAIPSIKAVEIINVPQDVDKGDTFDNGKLSQSVFYIRSGSNYNLSCSNGAADLWSYESGNPVEELDFDGSHLVVSGHELIFTRISPAMSGDYFCSQRDNQRIKYKLRVYTLAQLGANFSFSFLTTLCSGTQLEDALTSIKDNICGTNRQPIDSCPYRFNIDCDIRNISSFLSIKNKQRTVIAKVVAMKFTNVGRREDCDIKCNIREKNHQLVENLPQLETLHSILSESYTSLEGRYLKKYDSVKDREAKFVCKPGQVIRSQVTCVPCEAGYYSPSFGPESNCLPCPLGTYQSKMGGSSCHKCSNTSITMTIATNSSRGCLEKKFIYQAMLVNASVNKVQKGEDYYNKHFVVLTVLTSCATLASLSMWTVLIGQFVYEYVWDKKHKDEDIETD